MLEQRKLQKAELSVFKDQFMYRYDLIFVNDDNDFCSICLCDWVIGDECINFPICSHKFHFSCLEKWLKIKNSCPYCAGKFRENFLLEIKRKMETGFLKL